jgi:nucleotide-binding universal stress UspA family protein
MVQPDYATMVAVPMPDEIRDSLVASARGRLQRAVRGLRANADLLVETGDPTRVILEQASRLPAALLVLATSGSTGLARMVLGSVAEAVVRRAPCSTLVVREQRRKKVRPEGRTPPRRRRSR